MTNKSELISSAELTAYLRSEEPEISGDELSAQLVDPSSVNAIKAFKREIYPTAERHLALRNKFFLSNALQLLNTGLYDSCISMGSGFSLLSFYLAKNLNKEVSFFDTDLEQIIQEKAKRFKNVASNFPETKVKLQSLDVEFFADNKKKFHDFFEDIKSPLILMEGLSYFLKKETLEYLFKKINEIKTSAIIFDYWPENSYESEIFKKSLDIWDESFSENIKKVTMSEAELKKLADKKRVVKDIELGKLEKELCSDIKLQKRVPAHFCVIK